MAQLSAKLHLKKSDTIIVLGKRFEKNLKQPQNII